MKQIILIALCIPTLIFGSDDAKYKESLFYKLLKPNNDVSSLNKIDCKNSNIDSVGFKTLVNHATCAQTINLSYNIINKFLDDIKPNYSVTILNLSNNSFTDKFPLSTCVLKFPQLQSLTINNNNITEFEVERNGTQRREVYSSSLKTIIAHNIDCVALDLGIIYNRFAVTTLDLSHSKQLTDFAPHDWNGPDNDVLKIIVTDTPVDLEKYRKWGQALTSTARCLMPGTAALSIGLSAIAMHYLSIPYSPAIVLGIAGSSYGAGFLLTSTCLPNNGIRNAIQLIKES